MEIEWIRVTPPKDLTNEEQVSSLLKKAEQLQSMAEELKILAKQICNHKNDDGSFAVTVGCFSGGEECDKCNLEICYMIGYQKK